MFVDLFAGYACNVDGISASYYRGTAYMVDPCLLWIVQLTTIQVHRSCTRETWASKCMRDQACNGS